MKNPRLSNLRQRIYEDLGVGSVLEWRAHRRRIVRCTDRTVVTYCTGCRQEEISARQFIKFIMTRTGTCIELDVGVL